MTAKVDQKAYLQKYLNGPSVKKKKKKKVKGKGFKIIDDDLDLSKLQALNGDELDVYGEGEDAPQVVGIIDERPEDVKKAEQFKTTTKWKIISQDDGMNTKLQVEEIRRDVKEVEDDNELLFGKMYSDSEDENNTQTKAKNNSDSDLSPPRRGDMSKSKKQSAKQSNDSPNSKEKNRKYDSDCSPPRKESKRSNGNEKDHSPPRKRDTDNNRADRKSGRKSRWDTNDKNSNKHLSDKHKGRNSHETEQLYQRLSDSDESPPRKLLKSHKAQRDSSSDKSPIRKKQNSTDRNHERSYDSRNKRSKDERKRVSERHLNLSDSDLSPPRKDKNKRAQSPLPSNRYQQGDDKRMKNRKKVNNNSDSDSDMSPPRRNKNKKMGTQLQSNRYPSGNKVNRIDTKREKYKNESDSDLSPLRKEKNKRNDSPQTSKRRLSDDHDRRNDRRREKYKNDNDSDLSPPRRDKKKRNESPQQSKIYQSYNKYKENIRKDSSDSDSPPPSNKKMAKTLEGKLAGLQNAVQLREENEAFRKREADAYNRMTDDISGRNAQVVSRKKKRETSEDRQKQHEKQERQKLLDEKYRKWSRGLKQIEAQEERIQEYHHEASKPLARYKGDRDLEHRLKDVERDGDPMLKYIRERKMESGELGPEKPMYKGDFPPNRFNIRPGYRWDGVDRSNGYEKKYFEHQSKRRAQEEEAYKWSTEDL